jgi:hypothetical protein
MKKQKIARCFCTLTILLLLGFTAFSFFQINTSLKFKLNQKEYKFSLKDKNSSILFNENEEVDIDEEDINPFSDLISETILIYSCHFYLNNKKQSTKYCTQSKITNHLPTWLEVRHIII